MAAATTMDGGLARRLGERLLAVTALVPPSTNDPFAGAGTLAAGVTRPLARFAGERRFDVAEARARIADFVGGSYKPGSLSELMSYLAGRVLRLESRRGVNGQWKNYLVDLRTRGTLLAAEVDRRLSHLGIAQMFGRTIDAEAEVRRRQLQATPEMMDARVLRNELAGVFHRQGLVPDEDWESFDVTVSTMFGGRVVTAQGGELWVGREVARAGADPAENLRMMRRLQAEGRALVWPARTVEDARAGRLVHGMPILLREGAVRTRMIDPERLSMASLTRKFGEDYYEYLARKPRRPAGPALATGAAPENVVSMSRFRRAPGAVAIARAAEAPAPVRREADVPRHTARYAIRHETGRNGAERLVVRDLLANTQRLLEDTDLPAGRYLKEDGFGLPCGSLVISADGGYAHQDDQGRLHNLSGPAVVPAEGRPSYAIEGEILSARQFTGRQAAVRAGVVRRDPAAEAREADRREAAFGEDERPARSGQAMRPGR